MSDFFWRDFAGEPPWNRFPNWAFSVGSYRERMHQPEQYGGLLADLRSRGDLEPQERDIVCPRLFISHRQTDEAYALAIAHLAQYHGFYFWLDILDPAVAAAGGRQTNPLAIAIIIEMALLNCSHVIAVMTPNTKGSTWVPYEYGRVKKLAPVSSQASAWVAQGTGTLPEYLYLGPRHQSEAQIADWLDAEMQQWPDNTDCLRNRDHRWRATPSVPAPLPN